MCQVGVFVTCLLVFLQTNAESTDEKAFLPPSTVNFHDIYSNSLALVADESSSSATGKEDDFHISNMPSQFVEFRSSQTTVLPSTTTTVEVTTGTGSTERSESSSASSTTTTEEAEESSVKVLPIAKNYQRGVLDLLFPANRVKSFKTIFDSVKRILSHTFRR